MFKRISSVSVRRARPGGSAVLFVVVLAVAASCGVLGDDAASSGGDGAANPALDPSVQGTTVLTEESAAGAGDLTSSPDAESESDAGPTRSTVAVPTVGDLLADLTLSQKVGQLLLPALAGESATEPTPAAQESNQQATGFPTPAEAVEHLSLAGVMYLGPNIVDAEQLTTMSTEIQQAAHDGVGIGALIAVDQEGGRVTRIVDGAPEVPSARSLASDPAQAASLAAQTAFALRTQGINVMFAPVADLAAGDEGVIGDRSYSSNPVVASNLVTTVIRAVQDNDVAATAKHWPGHGATSTDSHVELPTVDTSRATWEERDRVPFQAAVDANVDMIMVGHLAYPSLDPSGQPATLSPVIVEELLRQELGFEGVIITDAMNMDAITEDPGEAAVLAIIAGNDLVLAPPSVAEARSALLSALASGRISEDRLDQSVARVLQLKLDLGLGVEP